jgi:Na+/melibiose symporter-like transporter
MDTAKIVALKQELVLLDGKLPDLEKKVKSKRTYKILGIICLILCPIMALTSISKEDSNDAPFYFLLFALFGIVGVITLTLGLVGAKGAKLNVVNSTKRRQEIKLELVNLEHQ